MPMLPDDQAEAHQAPRDNGRSAIFWLTGALGQLAVIALALAAVLVGCWLLYRREVGQIEERQAQVESVRVNLLAQLLINILQPVSDDLRTLADGDGFQAYLSSGQEQDLQRAIRRARFFSLAKPNYDKLRYIDSNGREILRINRGGRVVPGAELQNKADRHFFQQASLLAAGELYISDFDLNVESGRLERPLKPELRFAVPIFDPEGRRRGVYVINYLGAGAIEQLQQAAAAASHRVRLLNATGFWLKAADPAQEWGFMIPERQGFTLARSDPALWGRMRSQTAGQSHAAGSLISWRQVPTLAFANVHPDKLHTDNDFLIVASVVSPAEWSALFSGLRQIMLTVAATLALLTLYSAWLFRGRMQATAQLRRSNEELEARVVARTRELKMSNELLQYREQLLDETGSLAKVGGWELDPVSGMSRWTPEIARIYGLDVAEQAASQPGLRFYPAESRQRLQAALDQALTQGTPYDLELQVISASGEHKWVRTICRPIVQEGRTIRMRGALQDITERKNSELKLHAQLQRLRLLEQITRAIGERQEFGNILQIVVRAVESELPLDFGCIGLYDAPQRMLKIAAVGVAGPRLASDLSLTEGTTIPIDENGLSRCLRGQLVYEPDIEGSAYAFPQRLLAGGLRSMVAAPLQVESQVFGALIATRRQPNSFSSGECEFLRQLSEHVALAAHQAQLNQALQAAYEDLRNSQQAVMQQDRLRVLGQMASGMAHDINNAISPITLYTDALLERETKLSEQARRDLRVIQQAATDVAATVARMREFYRQREVQNELYPVQLNELVPQVVDLTRARWEAMPQQRGIVIALRTQLAAGLPAASGIESEIREALINLVFNAVDAMPTGGTLTLRTLEATADRVAIEVVDSGIGMDEETRRRCLEPFFTTKGERGTGLGLAMVYGMVQRHGGEIGVASVPGEGTVVRLCLAKANALAVPAAPALQSPPRAVTLLLVDDDPVLLSCLRDTLHIDGHTVLTANGGQAGIEQFRASIQPDGRSSISAVITDLGMPHVDGHQVAAAVKAASHATPVILLTGWGERLLADGCPPPHVNRVLSKPPRLRDLRKAIAEMIPDGAASAESPSIPG